MNLPPIMHQPKPSELHEIPEIVASQKQSVIINQDQKNSHAAFLNLYDTVVNKRQIYGKVNLQPPPSSND